MEVFKDKEPAANIQNFITDNKLSASIKEEHTCEDPFVSLFYELLRDYVHPGDMELVLRNSLFKGKITYTNKFLLDYAKNIVRRLEACK